MDLTDVTDGLMVVLDRIAAAGPIWYAGVPAAVAVLIVLAVALRRMEKGPTLARRVTTLATVLGLGWSAQGMWDAAVHEYGVPTQVASILFVLFEALLVSRMLWAHAYRSDLDRRTRHVRAVWLIACVMGLVVAFAEGLGQAPLRLSVPLLLAYGWWLDLTAEDDPKAKAETSRRWTWREVGLRVGWLRYAESDQHDPTVAERQQLAARIARLAFAIEHGDKRVTTALRRKVRLARLKLSADAAMLQQVAVQLDLSKRPIALAKDAPTETHPVMPPQPTPPVHVPTPEPTPPVEPAPPPEPEPIRTNITLTPLPQGSHRSPAGATLRGAALEADAVQRMTNALRAGKAMTNADLAKLYEPPLGQRTADKFGAKARKPAEQTNGHAVGTLVG